MRNLTWYKINSDDFCYTIYINIHLAMTSFKGLPWFVKIWTQHPCRLRSVNALWNKKYCMAPQATYRRPVQFIHLYICDNWLYILYYIYIGMIYHHFISWCIYVTVHNLFIIEIKCFYYIPYIMRIEPAQLPYFTPLKTSSDLLTQV